MPQNREPLGEYGTNGQRKVPLFPNPLPPEVLEQLKEEPQNEPPPPLDPLKGAADAANQREMARIRELLEEKARRRLEALALYEPMPLQRLFHRNTASERIIRGSNRAGKTLACAVEVARALTGQDPYKKYPLENGRWYAVAKDGRQIREVLWRLLGRAGAFKIIRDLASGQWRAFRPWDAQDLDRQKEAKPAPPLIPPRMIREISWENKKGGIPSVVFLRNGWELSFFSSLGKPPHGSNIDGAWFDEEIIDEDWYPEISARLIDRGGYFLWSATPQAGTERLFELHERAAEQKLLKLPTTVEFHALLDDNPHISEEQKRAFVDKMTSEEDRRVRVEGEFLITSFKIFPNWSRAVHGTPYFDIPQGWTRYAAIDPGHQVCAVLFLAVPPPDDLLAGTRGHIYAYDELYLKRCDAATFGKQMAAKTAGQAFEAFYIDGNMSRHTELGGDTVEDLYSRALKKEGVRSRKTKSGFIWGADNVSSGIEAIQSWLRIREDGTSYFKVLDHTCPNLDWEMKRYHWIRKGDLLTDKPMQKHNHLVDCLRYLAMAKLKYVKPEVEGPDGPNMRKVFLNFKKAQRKKQGKAEYVRLGPGG